MKKYIKALFDIFKNYNFYSIPILINEAIFYIRYNSAFNKFKYLNSDFLSDSIPCSYFFLRKIKSFIIKKNIKSSCDLGSGYGKIIYYLGVLNNFKIDGVELEKEIYLESTVLKNDNIKIFNEDILKFEGNNLRYNLFIMNDPLKKKEDLEKLILRIKKNYKKTYLIFINLNTKKLSLVLNNLRILDSLIISKSRNILFCSIN
tara:strand:- start:113 stop:721 length:609 start_codon:yes stop_codon:yes gene_type:complete